MWRGRPRPRKPPSPPASMPHPTPATQNKNPHVQSAPDNHSHKDHSPGAPGLASFARHGSGTGPGHPPRPVPNPCHSDRREESAIARRETSVVTGALHDEHGRLHRQPTIKNKCGADVLVRENPPSPPARSPAQLPQPKTKIHTYNHPPTIIHTKDHSPGAPGLASFARPGSGTDLGHPPSRSTRNQIRGQMESTLNI
jgi:hypothetical protein